MKKLFPAICMTLLAAALLGTSTFAWFSMNTQVSATGMTITATSDSTFLTIAVGDTWTDSITEVSATSSQNKELYPVTPAATLTKDNVTTPASWKYSYSNRDDSSTSNGTYTNCTAENWSKYVASETFQIGLNKDSGVNTSANNIRLTSVTLPANTGISCVVVCNDAIGTYLSTASLAEPLDFGVKATKTAVTVTVYYFINGEDTNVRTNNAAALTGTISLTFSVA